VDGLGEILRKRDTFVVGGPKRRPVRLKDRGGVWDVEISEPLLEDVDHCRIERPAADERRLAAPHVLNEIAYLVRHHQTEPRRDIGPRLALVEGVGAVAFAENAAPPGDLVGRAAFG